MNQHNNINESKKYEDDGVGEEKDRNKMKKTMQ